jgi:hypothetical protein
LEPAREVQQRHAALIDWWTGSPDPALTERLAELEQLMATLCQDTDLAG